ncbi:MAG: 3-deoxy-7-phosphoheptulonate synthase, partial [Pseudohongiellaceae bacterium]
MTAATDNLNITSNNALMTPQQLKALLPLSDTALETVTQARETIFS